MRFPIKPVILAVGVRSNNELVGQLAPNGFEIRVIGDALKPRKALDAVWEGFEVGIKI